MSKGLTYTDRCWLHSLSYQAGIVWVQVLNTHGHKVMSNLLDENMDFMHVRNVHNFFLQILSYPLINMCS